MITMAAVATARVNVTISGLNDNPVAVLDVATVVEDQARIISLMFWPTTTDVDSSDTRTVDRSSLRPAPRKPPPSTAAGVTYTPGPAIISALNSFTYTISEQSWRNGLSGQ